MNTAYLRPALSFAIVAASLMGIYHGTWKYDPARLEPQAAQGNAEAQYYLGKTYFSGYLLGKNYREAAFWLRKAARQGHCRAQAGLALMHTQGLGVRQDYAEAARWYRAAADQGLVMAQNQLAVLYVQGRGVSRDLDQSIVLFAEAARQGCGTARHNLTVTLAARSAQRLGLKGRGKVYSEARIQRVDHDGLTIAFAPEPGALGIAKIRFADLPKDLQQLYGYDFSRRKAKETGLTRLDSIVVQPL